jgi:hypothetical protein
MSAQYRPPVDASSDASVPASPEDEPEVHSLNGAPQES